MTVVAEHTPESPAPDRAGDSSAPAPSGRKGGPEPHPRGVEIAPGYHVVEHVHRGEDLDCYEIWSPERRCRCFAKTLRPDRAGDQGAREYLSTEAEVLLALTHPHIVRAYAYLEPADGYLPVLVLENLPGATLACLLDPPTAEDGPADVPDQQRRPRLSPADLGHLGQHLCSALSYLHGCGLLHRDIKPSNIIASHGVTRLIDLGLACPPGPRTPGSGTPGYMAPEQLTGAPLDTATDVWGVGLVLYESATGIQPFDVPARPGHPDAHGDTLTRCQARLARPAPKLRAHRRLPRPVAGVIDACLALDPRRRPTLDQLADALTELTGRPDLVRPLAEPGDTGLR